MRCDAWLRPLPKGSKKLMRKPFDKKQTDKNFVRRNEQIRIPRVLVVKDGVRLGTFPTFEALRMAREEGLDLVEVAPFERPPVCAIMDYGKNKYEEKKKQKKQQAIQKEKEISFRYVIDDHDLLVKANQIRGWLEDGDRVKITVKFKARENAHKDKGMAVVNSLLVMLEGQCRVEKPPGFEGSQIITRLLPKKKDK